MLKRFGFHDDFCGWVMQCLSSVQYSILFNGEAQGLITPTRGIRQGDPLFPYLFILCSEVLSGLCVEAQRRGSQVGIQVTRACPKISHLLFADDTMFFTKTNERCVEALKVVIQRYEAASGQTINTGKSTITFSKKTPPEVRDRVKSSLGISKEGGVGKYLGLPEHFGRKKKDLFASIVDQINQKAASWSTKQLSSAGKMTMLQSVLSPIPSHSMMCFKLSKSLTKRIQSSLTRFWWDTEPGKKKMCWISWEQIAKPKKDGGLGFRDVEAFNDALLAKQSWRILKKPDYLLAKVLLGKYCKTEAFLDTEASASCSHDWRSILCGRDVFRTRTTKTIGDGKDPNIWNEAWCSTDTVQKPMGPPNWSSVDLKVADLFQAGTK